MDGLDEAFAGERHSIGTYVGGAVFLAGIALVGVGALSVLLDALAGPAPSGVTVGTALALAGAAVTAVLLLGTVLLADGLADRRVRSGLAGSVLAVALVVPAWTATPSPIGFGGLLLVGLCFVASSLALTGVVFEGAIGADAPTGTSQASYVGDSGIGGPSPGVADGGSEDDDLEFLLDEDDDH
jgi:hypothetical protein